MKYFDLSLPGHPGEDPGKIHKVDFVTFRQTWIDFPREVAERMVELGYGRWVPCTVEGKIMVPQGLVYPEQFIFINLPTHAVKAAHVYALVENPPGPVPRDLVLFAQNLVSDVWYVHDPADLVDEEEYDASITDEEDELYDILEDFVDEEPEVEDEEEPEEVATEPVVEEVEPVEVENPVKKSTKKK